MTHIDRNCAKMLMKLTSFCSLYYGQVVLYSLYPPIGAIFLSKGAFIHTIHLPFHCVLKKLTFLTTGKVSSSKMHAWLVCINGFEQSFVYKFEEKREVKKWPEYATRIDKAYSWIIRKFMSYWGNLKTINYERWNVQKIALL